MSKKKLIAIISAILITVIAVVVFVCLSKNKPETKVEETTVETIVAATIADVTKTEVTTVELTETEVTEKTTKEKVTHKTQEEKSPYDKILDRYRKAASDYKKGVVDGSDKDLSASATLFGGNIKYAYVDINDDSVKELLVSSNDCVLNIWKLVDGEMKPLFKDRCFGRRADITLCQGGVLKVWGYYGRTGEYCFYKVESIDYDPVLFASVVEYGSFEDGVDPVYAKFDGAPAADVSEVPEENVITKEIFESELNKYKAVTGINWKKL